MAVTLIVQTDGAAVAGANTFVDVTFADLYFSDRGVTDWDTVAEKETALYRAAQYLETNYCYKGQLYDEALEVPFSRKNVCDNEGRSLDGIVPEQIKEAQCELALQGSKGLLTYDADGVPKASVTGAVITKVKLDVLEAEFTGTAPNSGTATNANVFDYVDTLIGFLTCTANNPFNGVNVANY